MTDPRRRILPRPLAEPIHEFLHAETTGGAVLLIAAVVALVWANSPFSDTYARLWEMELGLTFGGERFALDLRHWINDGLMTIFFLVVGLEIKRELVEGELKDPKAAAVPFVAAVGGMIVPAAIYLAFNPGGTAARGWGIPMATDIAFAVGVLALVGRRAPPGLRVFLLTLAIVDDIGAIGVIAVAYTDDLHRVGLAIAALGLALLLVTRTLGIVAPLVYLPIGLVVWAGTLVSGVHPTIAGVALGLATPVGRVRGRDVLDDLQDKLHPVSSIAVVPLFALANAGVALGSDSMASALSSRVTLGVALGLVAGKIVGIAGATGLAVRFSRAHLPPGVDMRHILGAAALGGIGFTVSLFITELAFGASPLAEAAKTGVLVASVAAALVGGLLLRTGRD
jgi:Na+:H+ antiporter, NhaA family